MKKIFTLAAALLMGMASAFAAPTTTPTVADVSKDYDVVNDYVVCIYFDEQVCNGIVWAGTYNNWATSDPATMIHGELLDADKYPGWYVFDVADTTTTKTVQGKPVQLQSDGTFDSNWDYQTGDAASWVNMNVTGTKTATVTGGYSGEADCSWPDKGVYIYESKYFKNHNTPCVAKVYYTYTINLYAPAFCDVVSDDSVRCVGSFKDWTVGNKMEKKVDDAFDTFFQTTFNTSVGSTIKFKIGTQNWDNQIQFYNDSADAWNDLDNIILGDKTNGAITYANDSTLTINYGDATSYRWTNCTGETALDEVAAPAGKAVKVIENGKMVIIRDEKRYNAAGMEIK